MVYQDRNRKEIRTSIIRAIGGIAGTATGGGDTSSLIDTYGLAGRIDDEFNGRSVYMDKVAGVAATSKTWVSDFTGGTTGDATLSPVVSGSIAAGDTYELYPRPFNVDDINEVINRAVMDASLCMMVEKETTMFAQKDIHQYTWPSGWKALHKVEFLYAIDIDRALSECDEAWTAGASVTASVDTSQRVMSTSCAKLVVASGAEAGAVLGYLDISSLDISDCDKIEFDMYSTIALTAGYLDFVLDNTSGCVSPVESVNIPAMTANTRYRHSISLANPASDTAIISLGVVNTTDVGACTLYFDNIHAVKDGSKHYDTMNPDYWHIVKGTTNYLELTDYGLMVALPLQQLRLTGYGAPALFTDDTTDSEIDPEFIVDWSLAEILLNNAKKLDIEGRVKLGERHLMMAERKKLQMSTNFKQNTRFA